MTDGRSVSLRELQRDDRKPQVRVASDGNCSPVAKQVPAQSRGEDRVEGMHAKAQIDIHGGGGLVGLVVLASVACSTNRVVQRPLSEQTRQEINETVGEGSARVEVAIGESFTVENVHLDGGMAEWTRNARRERVPEEAVRSVRRPRPLRGAILGAPLGALAGGVLGGLIGSVADQSCPGDCGQPARTLQGAMLGALFGAIILGIAGAAVASDTITLQP